MEDTGGRLRVVVVMRLQHARGVKYSARLGITQ
jgi:hypothetical protein